jgi:hypothetical protein
MLTAAAITARYSDADGQSPVRVKYESESASGILEVEPTAEQDLQSWRL